MLLPQPDRLGQGTLSKRHSGLLLMRSRPLDFPGEPGAPGFHRLRNVDCYGCGFRTRPRNRIVPVGLSRIRKMNG